MDSSLLRASSVKFRTEFVLLHASKLVGIGQQLSARTHLKSARRSSARHHNSREMYSVLFLLHGRLAQLGASSLFWSLVLTGKAWKPINPRKLSIKGFNHFNVRTTRTYPSISPFDGIDTVYLRSLFRRQNRLRSLVGLQTCLGHDVRLDHPCDGFYFTPNMAVVGWDIFL